MVLYFLLLTLTYGRISFNGIKAFLLLYLSDYLLLDDDISYVVFGWYTFLSFLFCAFAGFLREKFLDNIQISVIGLILQFIGFISLFAGGFDKTILGLAFLSVSNGMLKNSITRIIFDRFDDQYTVMLFYIFTNLGMLLAPVLVGYVLKTSLFMPIYVISYIGLLSLLGYLIYLYNQDFKLDNNFWYFTLNLIIASYFISLIMSNKLVFDIFVILTIFINIYFLYSNNTPMYMYIYLFLFLLITIFQIHIDSLQLFFFKYMNPILFGYNISLPYLFILTPLLSIITMYIFSTSDINFYYRILVSFILLLCAYYNLYTISNGDNFNLIDILPALIVPGVCEGVVYFSMLNNINSLPQASVLTGVLLYIVGISFYFASIINIGSTDVVHFNSLFENIIYVLIISIISLFAFLYYKNVIDK